MSATIATKTLRDQRRGLIGWAGGMVGLVLMYAVFYPSIRENAGQLQKYVQSMPDAMKRMFGEGLDFGTPVGYLKTELFSVMAPLLLLILSIGAGGRAIAGEEERRTLDLLLANPVTRRRVVLEKFAAMVGAAATVGTALWVGVALFGPVFGLRVDLSNLAAASFSAVLLGLTYGAFALLLGCWRGRRGTAIGVASALAVGLYLVDILSPSISGARWLEKLSPFHYYLGPDPLRNGFSAGDSAVLVVLAALFVGGAVIAFDRRDPAA
ncbi:MAG: ABC transporter permease subunit [Actinobacteria bacterium]|nr:ABC transporter permease subunit [Actinomycetota bacterium]